MKQRAEGVTDAPHAYQVAGVRHQAGFIICYGPQRAITQPWNGTSAANIHFSVTKSALCLLSETEASVSSALILDLREILLSKLNSSFLIVH